MRLRTIWTIPAMTLRDRLRETQDWAAFEVAEHLPKRVRYWVFIQVGGKALHDDELVGDVKFVDLLDRAEGGPR